MAVNFISHLKVDKSIVSLLSKSTYQRSFSSAIREIVSNAYDADSLSVKIKYDAAFSFIEIVDDGNGMTKSEFERYLTIAGKKQKNDYTRKYKRKRIGQFGVGFLSVFPFCESLEITTTAENSIEVLKASIPTKDYFSEKKNSDSDNNVDDILINGMIVTSPTERQDHYTKIKMVNPTRLVKQYFTKVKTKKRESIHTWEPKDRFIWELQEDLPISLEKKSKYYKSYRYEEPIGISIYVNSKELQRNNYLDNILDQGTVVVGGIKCKYVFTTNYKSPKKFKINSKTCSRGYSFLYDY